MLAILTGLVAGLGHVFSGPDHLAAVAPLAADGRGQAWRAGLRWGLGHTSGVLAVGVLFVLLKDLLPQALISEWSERLVGVVLVGIGLWGLRAALRRRLHKHGHEHDGRTSTAGNTGDDAGDGHGHVHVHVHVHDKATAHRTAERRPHAHTHAAFAVGTLHGLAGSAHVLGILPALAFATRAESFAYLGAFGAGTVLAMAGFAAAVGLVARGLAGRGERAFRGLMVACSAGAILVGVWWIAASFGGAHLS